MTLSKAAEELAAAGWPVFPVSADTKRPRTKHGHLDATTDWQVIARWASMFDSGGAIATPTGGGLLVIDVDPRNGGEVPMWAPTTRTVATQSGGLHLHYSIDGDIKSRAGLFGPGVDSKCSGGYVLLPPSPGYEWTDYPVPPRASVTKVWIERFCLSHVMDSNGGLVRLPAGEWHRGIIHDQVLAWAAWYAHDFESEQEVEQAVWMMVARARAAGCKIDNNGNHIGGAIEWVLERERQSRAAYIPGAGSEL